MTNTPDELKIYEIINRTTGEKRQAISDNTQNACEQAGWLIGDCFINEQRPRQHRAPNHCDQLLISIPCQVCPWQYAACNKPPSQLCPVQPTAPELIEWLKQATQAHLCHYVGDELTKLNYICHLKWVTKEQAIKELIDNPK